MNVAHRNGLFWLVVATGILASVVAGVSLVWDAGSGAITYVTSRGESIETYGRGIYEADSAFKGAGFRGTDAMTLLLGVPFLLSTAIVWRRGGARAGLLMTGGLAYIVYVYGSLALSAAYSSMFLFQVAVFSASLFALIWSLRSTDLARTAVTSERLPRRGLAIFLFASAAVTALVWLAGVVPDLVAGDTPTLEGSTTLVTHVLDLGVIVPAVALAGVLVLGRSPLGYAVAVPLLVLEVALLPMIVAQTVSQVRADVSFTTGEIVGPISGFSVLAVVAAALLAMVLRAIPEQAPDRAAPAVGRESFRTVSTGRMGREPHGHGHGR